MNRRARHVVCAACLLLGVSLAAQARAETYQVGPSRTYAELQDVTDLLNPGDIVEVDGDATYASGVLLERSGTADRRITLRGVRVDGKRPIISGTERFGFEINADYVTVEGFEITGGITKAGIGQYGHEVRISDCLLHDFPDADGIIGYGTGTGNTIIEYTEIYHTGNTAPSGGRHQIYMATDETAHPGSVFRLQYCYIHDAIGNSDVKSRSERNEIYYNWLESPGFHDMDLYGIDPDDNPDTSEDTAREDSDVVGNVVVCNPQYACARIGGDGTGNSKGRFRFVNNTFVQTGSGDIIRTFQDVETLEMYNNVIYNVSASSTTRVLNDADGSWVHGSRLVVGSNNFVLTGATEVPTQWTGTISGQDPSFADSAGFDFSPASGSPLIDAGAMETPTVESYPLADPLFPPASTPPSRAALLPGSAKPRASDGGIDIGAIELGATGDTGGAGGVTGEGGGGDIPGTGGKTTGGAAGHTTGVGGKSGTGGQTTGAGGIANTGGGSSAGKGGDGDGVGGQTTGAGGVMHTGGSAQGDGGDLAGAGGALEGVAGKTVSSSTEAGAAGASGAASSGESSSSGCGCSVIGQARSGQALWLVMGLGVGIGWGRLGRGNRRSRSGRLAPRAAWLTE
jgi:hypothetical protein